MKDQKWVDKMKDLGVDITPLEDGWYQLNKPLEYTSKRYKITITAQMGKYDGATGAIDIPSRAWIIHDQICNRPIADDGKKISAWMAAKILSDILIEDGYWWRGLVRWKFSTFLFGCKKARDNGWFFTKN